MKYSWHCEFNFVSTITATDLSKHGMKIGGSKRMKASAKYLHAVLAMWVVLYSNLILGQFQVRDSVLFNPHVEIGGGYQFPFDDMARRFGNSGVTGLGFHIKARTQWYYGLQGSYFFGNKVTEPGLMQNLYTDAGEILDNQGQKSIVYIQERGGMYFLDAGRLFPIVGPNPNSGVLAYAGVGYMHHKIRIEHQSNEIAQLEGEYLKGYDRLTMGPAAHAFLGYFHMSNNKLINFFAGVEVAHAWTKGVRTIHFDTRLVDHSLRSDGLIGVRAGWVVHLYRRAPDAYYFK